MEEEIIKLLRYNSDKLDIEAHGIKSTLTFIGSVNYSDIAKKIVKLFEEKQKGGIKFFQLPGGCSFAFKDEVNKVLKGEKDQIAVYTKCGGNRREAKLSNGVYTGELVGNEDIVKVFN